MFETRADAEISRSPLFSDDKTRTWSYVEQHVQLHWFHVSYEATYKEEKDGEKSTFINMLFISEIERLLECVATEDQVITQIYIVTPKHMNGSDQWKMELLSEILIGKEPETKGQPAHIFVLANGNRYIDSLLNTPECNLIKKKRLLKI